MDSNLNDATRPLHSVPADAVEPILAIAVHAVIKAQQQEREDAELNRDIEAMDQQHRAERAKKAKRLTSLFEDLIRWKVNLISLKDGLDLVAPAGRLMANILAGVAAYETEVRAERILAGQAAARERGIRWGGSIRGRRIRATVEQIAVIRRLRSKGGEIAAIARATGLSRPTIDRILAEDCNVSSGFSDGGPVGRVVCGTGPV